MSKTQDQIKAKKKELEASLVKIQEDIDQSIGEVKEDVVETLSPKELIKKHPLPVLGASIFIGFLLGSSRSSKKIKSDSKNSISSSVGSSLKKRVTQKAVDMALDFIEEKLSGKKDD